MMKLAIKVDVDTLRGYREGVPRLLSLFENYGIKASMFFSFGPDNSGKAIRRIFRKGFVSKMLRTQAPSTYGLKTLMYGTLLPAPLIVPSAPDIFKRAVNEGHDCGVHAWDHVYVQDKLDRISEAEFLRLFRMASELFENISGKKPECYAAPGWQCSESSLSALDTLGLRYASDTRGYAPYIPVWRGKLFNTPQLPTTLPTMDEIIGQRGIADATLPGLWLETMNRRWNVLTVHAEMEGLSKISVFNSFIKKALAADVEFLTLRQVAETAEMSSCAAVVGTVSGRAGTLTMQEVSEF